MVRLSKGNVNEPNCSSCFITVEVWIVIVEVGEDCGDNERNTFAVGAGSGFEVNAKGLVWVESVTSQ